MKHSRASRKALLALLALPLAGCPSNGQQPPPPPADAAATDGSAPPQGIGPTQVTPIPGHDSLAEDNSPKQGPRLLPVETYMRTYLTLFGGLSPLAAQSALQGNSLFDQWTSYLSVLGLPDYTADIPRGGQTNALMLAAFERIGVALCDRAVQHDLLGQTVGTLGANPIVFSFTIPANESMADAQTAFATRFDTLHRRFLGYPARLAPGRSDTFWQLYTQASTNQVNQSDAGRMTFSPTNAGWAAVCYGLVRHPEFHLY